MVTASSINAYDSEYVTALKERGIVLTDSTREDLPRGPDELWKAILAPRDSPEPNDSDAESLRQDVTDATNECATVEDMLPKLVPLEAIKRDEDSVTVTNRLWKRTLGLSPELKLSLTTPKPEIRRLQRRIPKSLSVTP